MFSSAGRAGSAELLLQFKPLPMAYIAPFRALRYDPQRVPLTKVVTQPYDKITLQMQDHYYEANPYNLVRIILGRPHPADGEARNVYTRAATFFQDWRRKGIFLQDPHPSLYAYTQRFTPPGGTQELERRGFIALGYLEDYSTGVVNRHEQTLARPKADRLALLRSTRAHFGQLFMLYSDRGEIETLLPVNDQPDIEVGDEYGVTHRVWRIADPGIVSQISAKMREKKLIIADGHHRYETALAYRDEQRAASATVSAAGRLREGSSGNTLLRAQPALAVQTRLGAPAQLDAPYEFAMMTFINMNSPQLLILPTHRVVHGMPSFSAARLVAEARAYFTVEEIDSSLDAAKATAILKTRERQGTALLAVTARQTFLMHSAKAQDATILAGLSPRQRALDVVQLHKYLLEGVLGLSEESIRNQQNISYLREAGEALEKVRTGGANVAFLMNPVPVEQVRDIAFAGEVLPQKSTDFYPKLLSGLTIYALD
jgi:uncharacterized protein (DUF1015 family)